MPPADDAKQYRQSRKWRCANFKWNGFFFKSLWPSAMYYVAGNTVLFTPFDKPICACSSRRLIILPSLCDCVLIFWMNWSFVNDQIDSGHTQDAERGVNCLWPVTTRIQTDNDTRPTCHRLFCFGAAKPNKKYVSNECVFQVWTPFTLCQTDWPDMGVCDVPISGC